MTAPYVHRQTAARMVAIRVRVRRLAAVATVCVTQCAPMPGGAQTRTVPPSTMSQSVAPQHAEARSATLPQPFDVASIHPDNSDHTVHTHIYSYANQGHFIAINATPMQLLQYAYDLPDSRILGASGWARSSKYDIEAKSDPVLADKLASRSFPDAKVQLLKMVQALLADRFHLSAHSETRELPIYQPVIAKGGVKFSA